MGAARTLIRKSKADQARRNDPDKRRVKPGTPFRRVVTLHDGPIGVEHTFHATKGHRFVRVSS